MKLQIIWKIPIIIPSYNLKKWHKNILFNKRGNKSFLNVIGGIEKLDLSPITCEPTNIFYQSIKKVKDENLFSGKKLPFTYNSKLSNSINLLNFKIHLYEPNLIILTIKLDIDNFSQQINQLHVLKEIKNHREIFNITKTIYGLLVSGDRKDFEQYNALPTSYSHIKINTISPQMISDEDAVEIVTGHQNTTSEIIHKALLKNKDHQINNDLILIDKQGIFARIDSHSKASERKVQSASNMFELALVLFISLSKNLELFKNKKKIFKHLIKEPDSIFLHSVTVSKTWNLLLIEFKLNELIDKFLTLKSKFSIIMEFLNFKKAIYAFIGVIFSLVATLYITKQFNKEDKIKLLQPIDKTPIEGINQRYPFKWEAVKGANYYVISIFKYNPQKNMWNNLFPNDIKTTEENEIKLDLNSSGKYQWKIIAKDVDNAKICDSDNMDFQLIP